MRVFWLTLLLSCPYSGCSRESANDTNGKSPTSPTAATAPASEPTNKASDDTLNKAQPVLPAPAAAQALPTPCVTPTSAPTRLKSIEDAVALVNALPMPVTMPCFIESIPRPLEFNATTSRASVQPADGAANPRIFLFSDNLILTLIPAGTDHDSTTIEFSVLVGTTQSVKAEIAFPVTALLSPTDPYTAVLRKDGIAGTRCSACHPGETKASMPFPDGAYISTAFRHGAFNDVTLESFKLEAKLCATATDDRCRRIRAIFNGDIKARAFPTSMATFFGG